MGDLVNLADRRRARASAAAPVCVARTARGERCRVNGRWQVAGDGPLCARHAVWYRDVIYAMRRAAD